MKIQGFSWSVSKGFDTQGRGGVYVALGFSGAQAEEKQFLRSGNRPENREIFRFPQGFSSSMKIQGFSWSVSKGFDTHALGIFRGRLPGRFARHQTGLGSALSPRKKSRGSIFSFAPSPKGKADSSQEFSPKSARRMAPTNQGYSGRCGLTRIRRCSHWGQRANHPAKSPSNSRSQKPHSISITPATILDGSKAIYSPHGKKVQVHPVRRANSIACALFCRARVGYAVRGFFSQEEYNKAARLYSTPPHFGWGPTGGPDGIPRGIS